MIQQWTLHGGALEAARAAFGDAPQPWFDLSTGINPHPWPVERAPAPDWTRLPETGLLAALEAAAARYFGVDPARLCATPGSEIALRMLPGLDLPAPYGCLWPAYQTHADAWPVCRRFDAGALEQAAGEGGTILLANPNNPDGRVIAPQVLLGVAEKLRQTGGWLVVDEAFADVRHDLSVASHVQEHQPVIVLRSFGKFFGLPGVRLGFAIGPQPVIAALRARLGSWPVSAAAVAIGTAAYRDTAWQEAARSRLHADRGALDACLQRHGLAPVGECSLFRLVETPGAAGLFEALAQNGILTRPFAYNPRWLRIGLPASPAALERMDAALGLWRRGR